MRRFDAHLADIGRAHGWLCAHGPLEDLLRARSGLRRAELPAGPCRPGAPRGRGARRRRLRAGRRPVRTRRVGTAPAVAPAARAVARCRCGSEVTWTPPSAGAGVRWPSCRALGDPLLARDGDVGAGQRGDVPRRAGHGRCSSAIGPPGSPGGRGRHHPAGGAVDLTHHRGLRRGPRAPRRPSMRRRPSWPSAWASPLARGWAAYAAGERRAEARRPGRRSRCWSGRCVLAEEVDAVFLAGVARHTLLTTAARADDTAATRCPGSARCWTPGTGWAPGRSCGSRCGRWPRPCPGAAGTPTPRCCSARCGPARGPAPRTEPTRPGCRPSRPRPGPPSVRGSSELLAEGAALGDAGAVALARRLAAVHAVRRPAARPGRRRAAPGPGI